jgi:hypothetical protein
MRRQLLERIPVFLHHDSASLPGLTWLDPAIHHAKKMDARVKPAHDDCAGSDSKPAKFALSFGRCSLRLNNRYDRVGSILGKRRIASQLFKAARRRDHVPIGTHQRKVSG